jgi:L-asparaginase
MPKPKIVVFSGPTATIGNSPALVTSNKARAAHDLPLLTDAEGQPVKQDNLRAQRIAAPVRVYVEAYTAHPLEADSLELSAPPDGWLSEDGTFSEAEPAGPSKPVFVVELRPEDGLYPLPYMGRQADGSAWDDATQFPFAPAAQSRQTFYPDASRIYEEVERLGVGSDGRLVELFTVAAFDFVRAAPPGGWKQGRSAALRSDMGDGDIAPEELGLDFHGYYPFHLHREPTLAVLAKLTNTVQRTLAAGDYVGAQWLEGSPTVEESMYWLGLLIDTPIPLVGHSAQRPHGALSADGDRNIVDGVKYILSGISRGEDGKDVIGSVLIVDEMIYNAREVTKVDARPGGYEVVGGHGGVVADLGGYFAPQLTFVPNRKHTWNSEVRLSVLPATVLGVTGPLGAVTTVPVPVKDADGDLLASALPLISLHKYARYGHTATGPDGPADAASEIEIMARLTDNLTSRPLAGFVVEGMSPYGLSDPTSTEALKQATFCGYPVVRVGRGNTGGMAYPFDPFGIAGNNLSTNKARLLLMAALLKLGALPPAKDPARPTPDEIGATQAKLAEYQAIFDTH